MGGGVEKKLGGGGHRKNIRVGPKPDMPGPTLLAFKKAIPFEILRGQNARGVALIGKHTPMLGRIGSYFCVRGCQGKNMEGIAKN